MDQPSGSENEGYGPGSQASSHSEMERPFSTCQPLPIWRGPLVA
ncbi:hypothetical protein V6Z12_A01G105200 [Gossypium hirsutum]